MSKELLNVGCPSCKEDFQIEMPVPNVRFQRDPSDVVAVYRITSDMIRDFIEEKAAHYVPGVKITVVSKYIEKKKPRKETERLASWASIRIAFSDDVLAAKGEQDWFNSIGGDTNIKFIQDVFIGFIKKYQYDINSLNNILGSYKEMEKHEDVRGITRGFIENIKNYTRPKMVKITTGENWIFFSAKPESIIADMLENPDTDQVDGTIVIPTVRRISKSQVEFIVEVHKYDTTNAGENPLVRQMLSEDFGKY